MSAFSTSIEREGDAVLVRLAGELDIATAPRAEEELQQAEEGAGSGTVVIDLAGLTFMDSTGLRMLVAADARAHDRGRRLAIVRGPEAVQRVIQLTGLDAKLLLVDDASEL